MARGKDVAAVNAAAIVQGLALVTFPAASTVFTDPHGYGLSSTAYGGMFVPQALMAIGASLLGAGLTRRLGIKRIYLVGLAADLLSMMLLVSSQFVMANESLVYGVLLLATASLGIGFGLTVPAVNTLTAAFFPRRIDSAVLILNALLGLGTVLAPIFVAIFILLGIWWGLPLLVALLLVGLILGSLRLPLEAEMMGDASRRQRVKTALPRRFWIFGAAALLYGIVETMSGNWAAVYMSRELGATATAGSLALAIFWGMVTVGRVLFAGVAKWLPAHRAYRFLPFLTVAAFVAVAILPRGSTGLGILAFGLAGLGCSALLPLTISFGQEELTVMAASVAGGLIAFYQVGYGIAAFGVGPLQEYAGLGLNTILGSTAMVGLIMAGLSFVTSRPPLPAPNRRPRQA